MIAYFDSSVVLSLLINDKHAKLAADLWNDNEIRVGSFLLEIECLVVLRRVYTQHSKNLSKDWLRDREKRLQEYLEETELKMIDEAIADRIRQEKILWGCRTLDAIHLATALLFKEVANAPPLLCTFDKQMIKAGKDLGLMLPEERG